MSDNEVIEADSYTDTESGYGSSVFSETTSLASSITDYVYENGRRYQRRSQDAREMPNDETEQDRLDLAHHLFLVRLGGRLHLSPLSSPTAILDCGTGTGIWALDVAQLYPSAQVTGIDLVPIQPSWTFPNCHFQVDDLEKEWTFPKNHFDLIHSRGMQQGIVNWPKYLEQMFEHTKPGGWIELSEHDFFARTDDAGSLTGTKLQAFFDKLAEGARAIGMILQNEETLSKFATDAGFVDVSAKVLKIPFGMWAKNKLLKESGIICSAIVQTGFEAHSLGLFTKVLGLEQEEAKRLAREAAEETLGRTKVKSYCHWTIVMGRKPEA